MVLAELGQRGLDLGAMRFQVRGQAKDGAELVERLVDGEARAVGRDLEEHAGRLAVVDGLEIGAVDDRADLQAVLEEDVAGGDLGGVVADAEGDVVDRAGAVEAARERGIVQQVDVGALTAVAGGITGAMARLADELVAHAVRENLDGGGSVSQGQGGAVEAADGEFSGDILGGSCGTGTSLAGRDQFKAQAVRIGEGQHFIREALCDGLVRHAEFLEALQPEGQ